MDQASPKPQRKVRLSWFENILAWILLMLSAGLGVWISRSLLPVADELYSLEAIGNVGRYNQAPLYYIYLNAVALTTEDFLSLRLWSLLPWIIGLLLSMRAFIPMGLAMRERLVGLSFLALNPYLIGKGPVPPPFVTVRPLPS